MKLWDAILPVCTGLVSSPDTLDEGKPVSASLELRDSRYNPLIWNKREKAAAWTRS